MKRLHLIFIVVTVFSVCANLLLFTSPLFMMQVYDRVLSSGSKPTLFTLLFLVVILYALMGVFDFARARLMARGAAIFQQEMDPRVFKDTIKNFATPNPDIEAKSAIKDVENVQNLLSSQTILSLFDLPWAPLFFSCLFIFHPWMGWYGLAAGAVLVSLAMTNELLSKRNMQAQRQTNSVAQNFTDKTITVAELVCSQGMLQPVTRKWQTSRDRSTRHEIAYSDVQGIFNAATKSVRMLSQSAMLALGAFLVLNGELSAGAIIAGTVLLGRALAPIEKLLSGWRSLKLGLSSWQRLRPTLEKEDVASPELRLERPKARIIVDDATVMNDLTGEPILHSIRFDVQPGEVKGVFGSSACGKSTLLKTILGLRRLVRGDIKLGDASIGQYASEDLGHYIGFMPQEVDFLPGTIAENIARFDPEQSEAAVFEAAKAAYVHEMILALPKGYETVLESGPNILSGGQKQRIALARALYRNPELLILDEPSAALDGEGTQALLAALKAQKEAGKSVILATHDPTLIMYVDRFIELKNGQLMQDGQRKDLFKKLMPHQTLKQASKTLKETADEQ